MPTMTVLTTKDAISRIIYIYAVSKSGTDGSGGVGRVEWGLRLNPSEPERIIIFYKEFMWLV